MSAINALKQLFGKKPASIDASETKKGMYYVASEDCIGCRSCQKVCQQGCIDFSNVSARILPERCVNCGKCCNVCPAGAIRKAGHSSL